MDNKPLYEGQIGEIAFESSYNSIPDTNHDLDLMPSFSSLDEMFREGRMSRQELLLYSICEVEDTSIPEDAFLMITSAEDRVRKIMDETTPFYGTQSTRSLASDTLSTYGERNNFEGDIEIGETVDPFASYSPSSGSRLMEDLYGVPLVIETRDDFESRLESEESEGLKENCDDRIFLRMQKH